MSKLSRTVFIFHGTEGYPEENWFPWLKKELENEGCIVHVPQFPSPPVVPEQIDAWFAVWKDYEQHLNEHSILIGHSLGGVFLLRLLERMAHPIAAACFIGTPVGVQPILNYERDSAFTPFTFDWEAIRTAADHFIVFQSDDDPYVSLGNGEKLAEELHTKLNFVPRAGHFNAKAGYLQFPQLKTELLEITGQEE